MFVQKKLLLFPLLIILVVVYWMSRRAYYVGFFNDDAFFIIGARSLLQGRFVYLNEPFTSPIIHYMPGYPLLLAPLALFVKNSFLPFQILSMIMVISALFLFLRRVYEASNHFVWAGVAVLSCFNPLTVSLSGTVLSDIPLLLFIVIVVWVVQSHWEETLSKRWAFLSAFAAGAFYFRPIGAVLSLALFVSFLWEKRFKSAIVSALMTAAVITPYFVRNYVSAGQGLPLISEYGSTFNAAFSPASWAAAIWKKAHFFAHELFVRQLFRWPSGPVFSWLNTLTVLAGVILTALAIYQRRFEGPRKFVFLFLALYLAVLLSWNRQSARYLFPVMPFFVAYFLEGGAVVDKRFFRGPWFSGSCALMSLCLMGGPLMSIFKASMFLSTPLNTPERATYDWIRSQTNSDDVLAAEWDGKLHLYTSRKTAHFPKGGDAESFYGWLRRNSVDYIVRYPVDFDISTQSKNPLYSPLSPATLAQFVKDDRRYELAYSNEKEGTAVYKVKP